MAETSWEVRDWGGGGGWVWIVETIVAVGGINERVKNFERGPGGIFLVEGL